MEKSNGVTKHESADYHLDELLKELGGFKRFQWMYCMLVSLPIILMACHVTSFVFTVSVPDYRCAIPECETGEFKPSWLNFTIPKTDGIYDKCKRYASDNNYTKILLRKDNNSILRTNCSPTNFDSSIEVDCKTWVYSDMNSIVGEFDLGCEQWKHTFVGSMNSIGSLMGTFFGGILCDVYGRKTVLIAGMFMSGISGLARIFSPEYWTFVAMEFFSGLFAAGVFNVSVIMCVEIVEPQYRVLATMFSAYFYAVGEIILGTVAWIFPYWKAILAILYAPSLLFILYIWLIPESIKWLMAEKKLNKITEILDKAAHVNKIQLPQDKLKMFYDAVERSNNPNNNEQQTTQHTKNPFLQLMKSKILVIRLIVCSLWFLLTSFVYFGLTFNPAMLSPNIHFNFILVSLAEVPGYTMYYILVRKYGRKYPMMISFICTGLTCIAFIFVPEGMRWLNITLFLFGKFFITISFTVVYIYSAELFPTFVRGTVFGVSSIFGGIGIMSAPQVPLLSTYSESLPFLMFGVAGIFCGLTSMMVPETANAKLPDTVEEAENIGKKPH